MFGRACAAAVVVLSASLTASEASAQAGPNLGMMMICTELKDNADRLQCYDKLVAEALKVPPAPAPTNAVTTDEQNWKVTESKSPVDDSPQLAAVLEAKEANGALIVRCYDKISEAYINLRTYVGGVAPLHVIYRTNQNAAVDDHWLPAKSGDAVFVPTPAFSSFVRSLPDDGTLFVRVFDFQSRSLDLTFALGPVSDVRGMLASTCKWPAADQNVADQKPAEPPKALDQVTAAPAKPRPSKRIVVTSQSALHWNVTSQRRETR